MKSLAVILGLSIGGLLSYGGAEAALLVPPSPSPPPVPPGQVGVSGPCSLTDGGSCGTSPHYPNVYGPNQACTIFNVPPIPLSVPFFDVEGSWCEYDFLTVNGVRYCGTSGPAGVVPLDGTIQWTSDEADQYPGWKARTPTSGSLHTDCAFHPSLTHSPTPSPMLTTHP